MAFIVKMLRFLLIVLCTSFTTARRGRNILYLRTTVSSLINATGHYDGSSPKKRNPPLMASGWVTRFVPSVYSLVLALGLPLNVMAIIVFLTKIKMRKPPVVYMLNLAFADVLFVSVLPFQISFHFSGNNWTFGPEMCSFVKASFFCNMYCSMLMMMVISIDRFLAVAYPVQSLPWRTVRRASATCIITWVVALAAVIPVFFSKQTSKRLNQTTCSAIKYHSSTLKLRYYHCILPVFFFLIPLIISTTCYVCIARCLHLCSAKPAKKRRAILLSATVLCCFIVCFGPANVLQMVKHFHEKRVKNLSFPLTLSRCLGTVNCCIDPLIYYYVSSEFQRHVRKLLYGNNHSEFTKGNQITSGISETLAETSHPA